MLTFLEVGFGDCNKKQYGEEEYGEDKQDTDGEECEEDCKKMVFNLMKAYGLLSWARCSDTASTASCFSQFLHKVQLL